MRKPTVAIASLAVALVWLSSGLHAIPPAQGSSPRKPASAQGARSNSRRKRHRTQSTLRYAQGFSLASQPKAIVDKYCAACHNERTRSPAISFSTSIDFGDVAASAEPLEKVVRKLGTGSMPPQGMPRPDAATHDALSRV